MEVNTARPPGSPANEGRRDPARLSGEVASVPRQTGEPYRISGTPLAAPEAGLSPLEDQDPARAPAEGLARPRECVPQLRQDPEGPIQVYCGLSREGEPRERRTGAANDCSAPEASGAALEVLVEGAGL